jgi:hypothetical protein
MGEAVAEAAEEEAAEAADSKGGQAGAPIAEAFLLSPSKRRRKRRPFLR